MEPNPFQNFHIDANPFLNETDGRGKGVKYHLPVKGGYKLLASFSPHIYTPPH